MSMLLNLISTSVPSEFQQVVLAALLVTAYFLTYWISKGILLSSIKSVIEKTQNNWDDLLLKRQVFDRLAYLPAFYLMHETLQLFLPVGGALELWGKKVIQSVMVVVVFRVISATLSALLDFARTFPSLKNQPLTSFGQVAKIILYGFATILVLGVILDRSPWVLLSGLGALTAVIMLVFKDMILGLVASVQLSVNDMVRVGDWIEMPKYKADGDVMEVTLNSIKVRNFDKTVSTIPTYALVSDSFKNWRGMAESGGRRIKRALYLDMKSVKFCGPKMLDQYERMSLLTDYIQKKRADIQLDAKERDIEDPINARRLTNLGTFRAYIQEYLRQNDAIHKSGMTFLVRQMPPSPEGIGLELYVFTTTTNWVEYEAIQADIFDHLIAKLPEFDLKVFQNPTGDLSPQ